MSPNHICFLYGTRLYNCNRAIYKYLPKQTGVLPIARLSFLCLPSSANLFENFFQTLKMANKEVDPEICDQETKRQEFSKALFNTLAPAVKQCDEVVRGVFQSQNKVLKELSNLEKSMVV